MKKKLISIVLIIAMTFAAGHTLAASNEETTLTVKDKYETQRLTLISVVSPSLRVTGSTASYSLTVTCVSSVNSIRATMQLQQFSGGRWVNYGSSWTATSNTFFLMTNGTRTVTSGGTYRLRAVITASNGSTTGTATVYS